MRPSTVICKKLLTTLFPCGIMGTAEKSQQNKNSQYLLGLASFVVCLMLLNLKGIDMSALLQTHFYKENPSWENSSASSSSQ
jgi:hypothetical protein